MSTSTIRDKTTVCCCAFALACAAFTLGAFVLIPLVGFAPLPEVLTGLLTLLFLIGMPIIGALGGIQLGSQLIKAEAT